MITAAEARKITESVESTISTEVKRAEDMILVLAGAGSSSATVNCEKRFHVQFKGYLEGKGYTVALQHKILPEHDIIGYIISW